MESLFLRDLSGLSIPQRSTAKWRSKTRKVFDELIERRHGAFINPPKPMKGESDTKATDVNSKRRMQRNVPMGDEGQWKGCSYGIC
jgi:hypothetical protein